MVAELGKDGHAGLTFVGSNLFGFSFSFRISAYTFDSSSPWVGCKQYARPLGMLEHRFPKLHEVHKKKVHAEGEGEWKDIDDEETAAAVDGVLKKYGNARVWLTMRMDATSSL